jgi:UDP-N-acetylmuramyl tripeptide synthase
LSVRQAPRPCPADGRSATLAPVSTKKPLRSKLASSVSRSAAALSRVTGRGDGSVIGGRLGLMIDPHLLANLAVDREIALISGTNGKTTTTRLTAAAVGVLGDVATNSLGANMPSGHTSALARAGSTPYAVLEVDEHYLPEVLTATNPKVVALLNLSRDQLDRAKEVAMMADLWRRTLTEHPVDVVANADDPMITWAALAAKGAGAPVTWVAAGQRWHDDSWVCPECGSPIERAVTGDGESSPLPDVALTETAAGVRRAGPHDAHSRHLDPNDAAEQTDLLGLPIADPLGEATMVVSTVAADQRSDRAAPSTANGGPESGGHLSVDEHTMLMPTVPVPDAAHPAGRPSGAAGTGGGNAPVLAPITAPETVPATTIRTPHVPPASPQAPASVPVPVQQAVPTTAPDADWWCTGCSLRRPTPQWRVEGDAVIDPTGRAHVVDLQLPGRVNRANAATALAVAAEFGVDPALAAPRLAQVRSIAGRYAQVQRDGRTIRLLLAKNPAGWLEAFDMAEDVPTLLSINSRDPDGLDTSWLFDVDFSPLHGRTVLITGERAYDLAVRLEVNDIPFVHVGTFAEALRSVPAGRVEVIANYTAFQDIRAELDRVN